MQHQVVSASTEDGAAGKNLGSSIAVDMIKSPNVVELVESIGPWPFITRRVYRSLDHSLAVWRSRHHRKGLPFKEAGKLLSIGMELRRCFWMPQEMNWWIGIVLPLVRFSFCWVACSAWFPIWPACCRSIRLLSAERFSLVPYRLQPLPICSCFRPPTQEVSCPAVGNCRSISVGLAGARVTLAG